MLNVAASPYDVFVADFDTFLKPNPRVNRKERQCISLSFILFSALYLLEKNT